MDFFGGKFWWGNLLDFSCGKFWRICHIWNILCIIVNDNSDWISNFVFWTDSTEIILYLELYPITVHNATMTPVVLLCWPFGPIICHLLVFVASQNTKKRWLWTIGHDESNEEADKHDDINDSADEGDKKHETCGRITWCVCRWYDSAGYSIHL